MWFLYGQCKTWPASPKEKYCLWYEQTKGCAKHRRDKRECSIFLKALLRQPLTSSNPLGADRTLNEPSADNPEEMGEQES